MTRLSMDNPHITPADNGEYSTVRIGDYIETRYFDNDGSSRVIARTYLAEIAREHIERSTWHPFAGNGAE